MTVTIDELLNALQNPSEVTLENTKDTWSRIGSKDDFAELGMEQSELDAFLKEWQKDNPYENI